MFDRDNISVLSGVTHRISTPCGKAYITVNTLDGKIVEVFAHAGKAGACVSSNVTAICRLVSIGLQSDVPLERLLKQLLGNQCEKASVGFEATSCADAIGKILTKVREENEKKT